MANPKQIYERNSKWHRGVMRSLATDVIVYGRVETNLAKAKELRKWVDNLVTCAKVNTLASRRRAATVLRPVMVNDKTVLAYLFETVGPKYNSRNGGYTRVVKLSPRRGDNTKRAIIELV